MSAPRPVPGAGEEGRGASGRGSRRPAGGLTSVVGLVGRLLPGAAALRRGEVAAGAVAMLVWLASMGVLLAGPGGVLAALGGPWDHRLAAATVAAGIVTPWVWSLRSRGGRADAKRGRGGLLLGGAVFAENRLALTGLLLLVGMVLLALLAPLLATHPPDRIPETLAGSIHTPPSAAHLLGTDALGRDVYSRLLYGARVSLLIGVLAVGVSVLVGTAVGVLAGFHGGRVDRWATGFVDVVIAFPRIVLVIAVAAILQPSIVVIVLILGLTQWPPTARLVRAEALSVRERSWIEAGRALGFSTPRLVLRHLLPNVLAPVIVAATLGVGHMIVLEAGLSFLGIGVQPPTPSWGGMIDSGRDAMPGAWWLSVFPGLLLVVTVVAFNLVGDALRDALDPRLRGER